MFTLQYGCYLTPGTLGPERRQRFGGLLRCLQNIRPRYLEADGPVCILYTDEGDVLLVGTGGGHIDDIHVQG